MCKLESNALTVRYDASARQILVTDKRMDKTWTQASFPDTFVLHSIKQPHEACIIFTFDAPFVFTLNLTLEQENELCYTISAAPDQVFEELAFPPAFPAPDDTHFILQTDSEGLLLPVNDCGYPLEQQPMFRCSGGPGMAWLGMVDEKLSSGYMTIYETPYDADILLKKTAGRIDFSVIWQSSMGHFSYDRKIRTIFFDQGGYVAQCKRYRSYAWGKNQVSTLRSKLERFPNLEKILGAVHIYVWDDARRKEFLEELHDGGIDKALILWNPNHLPYPDDTFTPTAKSLGYSVGNQELFTDIHPDTPQRLEKKKRIPLLLNCYPGQFDYLTAKTKDGGTYSNQFGIYVCPKAIRAEMKKRIEQTLQQYPQETVFLDVYQANGLYECYDERHPLTREEYAKSIIDNMQWIEDTYGLYLGSEFGADYGAGHGVYVYGMMTLQRTWFDSEATIPGSIYYIGDWKNNERPSIMLGSRTATPAYHQYSLNEYTRVPLYELVYHDAVITSWRWEDCNHHYPEIWWKKDLLNILYGSAPIWSLDQSRFTAYKETFLESYRKISPWLKEICLEEMVDHHFLSDDHTLQESIFSSGKRVIVNFSDQDRCHDGIKIPARDFVLA